MEAYMKLRFFSVLVVALLMAFPAFALDLHEARHAGIVGETAEGYIAALKDSTDADALVIEINEKRRQEYTLISQENNQPVEVVAKLAAQQIINKLEPGEYYQDAKGDWKTR